MNIRNQKVCKKKNPTLVFGADRKFHPLGSVLRHSAKPRDATQWPSRRNFLSVHHTHVRFLYSHIPMPKRSNRPCAYSPSAKSVSHRWPTWFKRCYIRDKLYATLWCSKLSYFNGDFYDCDVGLCNSDSNFQTPIFPLFLNKNIKCLHAFS